MAAAANRLECSHSSRSAAIGCDEALTALKSHFTLRLSELLLTETAPSRRETRLGAESRRERSSVLERRARPLKDPGAFGAFAERSRPISPSSAAQGCA